MPNIRAALQQLQDRLAVSFGRKPDRAQDDAFLRASRTTRPVSAELKQRAEAVRTAMREEGLNPGSKAQRTEFLSAQKRALQYFEGMKRQAEASRRAVAAMAAASPPPLPPRRAVSASAASDSATRPPQTAASGPAPSFPPRASSAPPRQAGEQPPASRRAGPPPVPAEHLVGIIRRPETTAQQRQAALVNLETEKLIRAEMQKRGLDPDNAEHRRRFLEEYASVLGGRGARLSANQSGLMQRPLPPIPSDTSRAASPASSDRSELSESGLSQDEVDPDVLAFMKDELSKSGLDPDEFDDRLQQMVAAQRAGLNDAASSASSQASRVPSPAPSEAAPAVSPERVSQSLARRRGLVETQETRAYVASLLVKADQRLAELSEREPRS